MKKTYWVKWAKRWLLVIVLTMPSMGMAESPKITVDPVIHDGRFVIFVLRNYEDRDFVCTFIQAKATVKNHQGKGEVITRRSIVAENVALLVNSREKQVEVDKEFIKELENQFDQPRIVDISDPKYSCEPKTVTTDKKAQPQPPPVTADKKAQPQTASVTADKKVFRDRLKDGSLGPEMVWIPAGRFRMGDIQGGGQEDEQPVHWVSVDKFAMGRYEVTFAEYDKFAEATGREKPDDEGWGRGNRPVINVHWHDAELYTKWLSQQTGQQYRLPTEAEWEYAARAGTETKYWWGNTASHEYANYGKDECCGGLAKGKDRWKYTSPVGSFQPNPFGLYDTLGNVMEWTCSSGYEYYNGKEKQCLRRGYDGLPGRVQRGGSWKVNAYRARAAARIRLYFRGSFLGFRVVRTK